MRGLGKSGSFPVLTALFVYSYVLGILVPTCLAQVSLDDLCVGGGLLGILPVPLICQDAALKAVCELTVKTDSNINGKIYFTQDGPKGATTVEVSITNLPGKNQEHGFHIHTTGDFGTSCDNAGAHYNPFNKPHGRQTDDSDHRHVGDLGNIYAKPDGFVHSIISDLLISITGEDDDPYSVIGRSCVVHEKIDDFTGTSGNAGARVACGKVVVVE